MQRGIPRSVWCPLSRGLAERTIVATISSATFVTPAKRRKHTKPGGLPPFGLFSCAVMNRGWPGWPPGWGVDMHTEDCGAEGAGSSTGCAVRGSPRAEREFYPNPKDSSSCRFFSTSRRFVNISANVGRCSVAPIRELAANSISLISCMI